MIYSLHTALFASMIADMLCDRSDFIAIFTVSALPYKKKDGIAYASDKAKQMQ